MEWRVPRKISLRNGALPLYAGCGGCVFTPHACGCSSTVPQCSGLFSTEHLFNSLQLQDTWPPTWLMRYINMEHQENFLLNRWIHYINIKVARSCNHSWQFYSFSVSATSSLFIVQTFKPLIAGVELLTLQQEKIIFYYTIAKKLYAYIRGSPMSWAEMMEKEDGIHSCRKPWSQTIFCNM